METPYLKLPIEPCPCCGSMGPHARDQSIHWEWHCRECGFARQQGVDVKTFLGATLLGFWWPQVQQFASLKALRPLMGGHGKPVLGPEFDHLGSRQYFTEDKLWCWAMRYKQWPVCGYTGEVIVPRRDPWSLYQVTRRTPQVT